MKKQYLRNIISNKPNEIITQIRNKMTRTSMKTSDEYMHMTDFGPILFHLCVRIRRRRGKRMCRGTSLPSWCCKKTKRKGRGRGQGNQKLPKKRFVYNPDWGTHICIWNLYDVKKSVGQDRETAVYWWLNKWLECYIYPISVCLRSWIHFRKKSTRKKLNPIV